MEMKSQNVSKCHIKPLLIDDVKNNSYSTSKIKLPLQKNEIPQMLRNAYVIVKLKISFLPVNGN